MTKTFTARRRQQFLTRELYETLSRHLVQSEEFWETHDPGADSPLQARSIAAMLIARNRLMLLTLRYTAGEHIHELRDQLESVVLGYEKYQLALAKYEQIPEVSPLGMGRIDDYETCMQLIGLCYLLHRRDLLSRVAALQDPGYAGQDALYEELLAYHLRDRFETDAMFHIKRYDRLIEVMYADDDAQAIKALQGYLETWYPSFRQAPWHDAHTRINGDNGDYCGYWAFEAAALAYLTKLDDAVIDHMVYPKDLVKFAREYDAHVPSDNHTGHLRCEAGQPCPSTGWWLSPAAENSRRYFQNGEIMPDLGGDYGATIWQWDADQSA